MRSHSIAKFFILTTSKNSNSNGFSSPILDKISVKFSISISLFSFSIFWSVTWSISGKSLESHSDKFTSSLSSDAVFFEIICILFFLESIILVNGREKLSNTGLGSIVGLVIAGLGVKGLVGTSGNAKLSSAKLTGGGGNSHL